MKKIIAIVLSVVFLFSFTACNDKKAADPTPVKKVKIGAILLHNETVGYDKNFIDALEGAKANIGADKVEIIYKKDTPETVKAYDNAVDLAEQGCDIIFADSFSHESFIIKAAKEYPNIQFIHATGVNAKLSGLANMHNAFARIFEGRYLAGVIAGMKMNELIAAKKITEAQAKIGYIAAMPYAEVISGYTSFYLGARSVCPSATMEVTVTGTWADYAKENEAAKLLIKDGCVVISEHADTYGSSEACEANMKSGGISYHVGYNIDFNDKAPTANLVSSKINWLPYFENAIKMVQTSGTIAVDTCEGLEDGTVALTAFNDATVTADMKAKFDEVSKKIISGETKVFDVTTFKLADAKVLEKAYIFPDMYKVDKDGHLTYYMADAIADAKFAPDTQVILNGEFSESTVRSAPYFNIIIDGVTLK